MWYQVTAPVKGVNSTVAGVRLVDSVGVVDGDEHPSTLAYFRRHGYKVEEAPEPVEPELDDVPAVQPPATPAVEPPARGATKDTWVTYVTSEAAGDKRLTLDEATALKRDELADHVLGPKEAS